MTQRIAILLRNLNRSSNLSKSKSDHLRLLQARDRECTRSMLHQDGTRLHAEQELIHMYRWKSAAHLPAAVEDRLDEISESRRLRQWVSCGHQRYPQCAHFGQARVE